LEQLLSGSDMGADGQATPHNSLIQKLMRDHVDPCGWLSSVFPTTIMLAGVKGCQ
jgi:hypothetical protein